MSEGLIPHMYKVLLYVCMKTPKINMINEFSLKAIK